MYRSSACSVLAVICAMGAPVTAGAQTTQVYFEDFEDGPGGWTPRDFSGQTGVYWHLAPHPDGLGGDEGVVALGTDDPCYATPPGYGQNWDQRLSRQYQLAKKGPIEASYSVYYDNEPGFDYLTFEVSTDGGSSWTVVDQMNGQSAGMELRTVDLTAYAGQRVLLGFHFESDGGADDQDGGQATTGMFVDWITVGGKTTDFDWEGDQGEDDGGSLAGWTASAASGLGVGEYRLDTYPSPIGLTTAWVGYETTLDDNGDPVYTFPFAPPGEEFHSGIESDWIALPETWDELWIGLSQFGRLPVFNLILYRWEVSTDVDECYRGEGLIFGNPSKLDRPLSSYLVPPEATQVRVRLHAVDLSVSFWWLWTGVHSEGPIFDNVEIYTIP